MNIETPVLFEYDGPDALSRLLIFILPLVGGGAGLFLTFEIGGRTGPLAMAFIGLVVALGLRARVVVRPDEVVIAYRWFFVTYRTYRGKAIDELSYGGDYGGEHGAVGVVLRLAGREHHIGTPRDMRYLHKRLASIVVTQGGLVLG